MEEKTALLQTELEETHQRTFLRWINGRILAGQCETSCDKAFYHQLKSITDFDDGVTLIVVCDTCSI